MHLNLRLAKPSDAPVLEEVRDAAIQSIDREFYSALELDKWVGDRSARVEKLAVCKPHIVRIVAESDSEIVGFGEMSRTEGLISACFVKASAKGRGVGRQIIAALEWYADEAGLSFMQLEASKNAKKFYLSCGFRPASDTEVSIPNPRYNLCSLMRKDLS